MNASLPRTILLVEDDFLTAMLERKQLEQEGYTVIHVASGEKAIDLIVEQVATVDLILMDIDLGVGMDGTEAAQRILAIQDIPVVFLSSHTEKEIVQKTEQITSYGYVVKSSSFTVLDASIKMAFKLFESRKQYQRTFDHSINGLCIHRVIRDMDGTPCDCEYIKVNTAFERHSGLSASSLVGRTIREVFPEGQADEIIALYVDAFQRNVPIQQEIYFEPLENWFRLSVFPIAEEEFTVVMQNITDRKRVDEALRSSESELTKAQKYGNIGSWIWHIQDNRLEWSEQMFSIFGIHRDTFAGELTSVISSSIHPEDRVEVERSNASVAQHGKPIPLEYRIIRPDGVIRTVWAEAGELENDADGKPSLLRGIVQDITERKQIEERIQTLLDEKQLLLKETHHRIKNDMNMIYSLLYLQANNQSNAEASSVLMNAASRTQGMLMLYEKLYCSSDYKKLGVRLFLAPLIEEIIHILPSSTAIRTEVDIADFMLNARILSRLGIIVNELITNSVKYAFKGRAEGLIKVTVSVDGASAVLDYSDDGPGLPAVASSGISSSGFGMQLIDMMVDEITGTVEIVRNTGANFIIRWPL